MKWLLTAISVSWLPAMSASDSYDLAMPGILRTMASSNVEIRQGATNMIDALAQNPLTKDERANCMLLKAKLRIECADAMGVVFDNCAYDDATNLCFTALGLYDDDRQAWQFYSASLLAARALSIEKKFAKIFAVSTNALGTAETMQTGGKDAEVREILHGQCNFSKNDIATAMRTLAAASLLSIDSSADISTYTNGLPPKAISLIDEFAKK